MAKKHRKLEDLREGDLLIPVPDPKETDLIIPIMGPTGAGRSTFINTAAGETLAKVGDELESCTSSIQPVVIPYPRDPARRLVLVDTPGFDDTYIDDTEILRRIAVWLAQSYNENMKLAGVVYLHEITQTRMIGTARKNFAMFNRLCGEKAARHVILATTKWSHIQGDVGEQREKQLALKHWRNMLDGGSQMLRFRGDQASALNIVSKVIEKGQINILQIQDEVVELQKRISETEAGSALRVPLQELPSKHDKIQESDPREGDTIILVMGVTGAGKSTFINVAAGKHVTNVSSDLDSEGHQIQPVVIPHPGDPNRRVAFVDTPAFSDTWIDNRELFGHIGDWLEHSCKTGIKLAGVIYLHEISQSRFSTTGKDLLIFQELCPPGTFIVATTKWTQPVVLDNERQREEQLCTKYCKGLDMARFVNTHESAWNIADLLLQNNPTNAYQFRDALINVRRQVPETKSKTALQILAFLLRLLLPLTANRLCVHA